MALVFNKFKVFIAFLWLCPALSLAMLPRFSHPIRSDGSLRFLVVGDWGRKGLFNQTLVSTQMGITGGKLDIDFVISDGDNFYDDGLTGVDDPAFKQSFTDIYTAPSLQKRWYTILGNHDYRGDALAQLNPSLKLKDNRWFCLKSFILTAGSVDFVFVDTTPFVNKYFDAPGDDTYDWRGVLPRDKYVSDLLKDVNDTLRASTAQWKIVVGHHPVKSAGEHGSTVELEAQLLPILQVNKVDMYVNGHDHNLQHIMNNQIQFLTSGGGSKAWRGDLKPWDPQELKLLYDGPGFMSAFVTRTTAQIVFYDINGNVLHNWNMTKA